MPLLPSKTLLPAKLLYLKFRLRPIRVTLKLRAVSSLRVKVTRTSTMTRTTRTWYVAMPAARSLADAQPWCEDEEEEETAQSPTVSSASRPIASAAISAGTGNSNPVVDDEEEECEEEDYSDIM